MKSPPKRPSNRNAHKGMKIRTLGFLLDIACAVGCALWSCCIKQKSVSRLYLRSVIHAYGKDKLWKHLYVQKNWHLPTINEINILVNYILFVLVEDISLDFHPKQRFEGIVKKGQFYIKFIIGTFENLYCSKNEEKSRC